MNWNKWIRQFHRWMSIFFTLTVIVTFIALAQEKPIVWVSYVPLLPLALLVLTGLYLFALPYLSKWRGGQRRIGSRQGPRTGQVYQPHEEAITTMKKTNSSATEGAEASQLIDARIRELNDWRGETLARVRTLIQQADPDVVEEWKWGVPVWSHAGILCTGESYKSAVKLTFAKGASLADPSGLFNSSLEGNTRRAIDIRVDDEIDEKALKTLIRAAVALNTSA